MVGPRLVHAVDGIGRAPDLWWEGDVAWADDPADLDAAAVALQPLARRWQHDLVLHGRVARSRLANLEEHQEVWARWEPDEAHRVDYLADEVGPDVAPVGRDAILAFSGGVDACYSLVVHREGRLGHRTLDPTVALFVHGLDIPLEDTRAAETAIAAGREITSAFGLPLRVVRTNWRRDFCASYPKSFLHALSATMRVSAPRPVHLVTSTGTLYESTRTGHGHHPITDPLLGQVSHPVVSTGFSVDRVDKIAVVGAYEVVRQHLRVCWQAGADGGNCGECEKCVRTKLGFLAAGVGEIPALGALRVDQVAAIPLPSEIAVQYLREVLARGDALGPRIARAVRERLGS